MCDYVVLKWLSLTAELSTLPYQREDVRANVTLYIKILRLTRLLGQSNRACRYLGKRPEGLSLTNVLDNIVIDMIKIYTCID